MTYFSTFLQPNLLGTYMSDYSSEQISEILTIVRKLKDYPPTRDEIKEILKKLEKIEYKLNYFSDKMETFLYQWERVKDKLDK